MKKNIETSIQFTIYKIETTQFAVLSDTVEESALTIKSGVGFGIDEDNRLLRAMFKYEFQSNNATALILEVAVDFQIENKCFEEQIKSDDTFKIPKVFATHLAMLAVGVGRGILHEKTNGTALNNFPMPPIDITESITDDILFNLEK